MVNCVMIKHFPVSMIICIIVLGCSSSSPVLPDSAGSLSVAQNPSVKGSYTHLWGYYDVFIDIPSKTVSAVLNRELMFSANVVNFLNGNAANMGFKIIDTPTDPGGQWVDVDIDVTLKHPFPGMTQYNGYDVRGVFVGNGSATLDYNDSLVYAVHGSSGDQEMFDYNLTKADIHPGLVGMPDGYTRWFNPVEFLTPGMFGYTHGKLATPGYKPTGTLNPYKYFADGLGPEGDAWTFITTSSNHRVFSAGSSNTRNYYLRFPNATGVKYGYIVIADWKSDKPVDHPSNAIEACAASVTVTPDLYYVSPTDKGGKLILDISLPVTGNAFPSTIFVESTVLSAPYQMVGGTPEMNPVGGGDSFSTWHTEIVADNITGNSSTVYHELWIIPQYDNYNYNNDFGIPNYAGDDKLAAFFRSGLYVHYTKSNSPPIAALAPVSPKYAWQGQTITVQFDASGSTDPDPQDIPFLTYTWDFNNDGTFGDPKDGGTDIQPIKKFTSAPADNKVYVKVTDPKGAFSTAWTTLNATWFTVPKGKDISGTDTGDQPLDLCIDPTTGDCLVLYTRYTPSAPPYQSYVRRYKMSTGYNTYATISVGGFSDYFGRIDCNTDGWWFIMGLLPSPGGSNNWYWRVRHYNPSDTFVIMSNGNPTNSPGGIGYYTAGQDAIAMMNTSGVHAKDHVAYKNPVFSSPWTSYVIVDGREETAFTSLWSSSYTCTGFIAGCIYLTSTGYMRAAEADLSGPYIWFLRNGPLGDTLCNLWDTTTSSLTYMNKCIGTGYQGSTDDTWRDGRDVTIGEQNTLYILDLDGSTTRVKGFKTSDCVPVGSVVVTGLTNEPQRLDGSREFGFLVMLEGFPIRTENNNYGRLYVLTDAETPPN